MLPLPTLPSSAAVSDHLYDVIVVGSGPAAMSACLTFGRASLSTLVISLDRPRNHMVKASHGLFTRDGVSPGELLEAAKHQLQPYETVENLPGQVVRVDEDEVGLFWVVDGAGGRHHARRVVLATGMHDDLTATGIPGIEKVYGHSVFPCPFCDGFEHRHDALAVFTTGASPEMLNHYLAVIQTLSSSDVIWFANGQAVPEEVVAALREKPGVEVELASVAGLEQADGQLTGVRLVDGRVVPRNAGFVGGDYARPSPLLEQLGLATERHMVGWVVAQSMERGRSSRPGIYVAGDVRAGFGGLSQAVWQGTECATGIVQEIAAERWGG